MSKLTGFNQIARDIVFSGVTSDSHHMTIKKAFRMHDAADITIDEMRELLLSAQNELDDATDELSLKRQQKQMVQDRPEMPAKPTKGQRNNWYKVAAITERGNNNQPKRVLIECQNATCDNLREIATQDLFQVDYCSKECKREADSSAREDAANEKQAHG